MADIDSANQTDINEFILQGFGNLPNLQILLFLAFLAIYITTMAGNSLVMVLIVADQHLHTPMYFFLGNLSCLETCYTSTILPRMLASLVTGNRTISFSGCFTQLYFFGVLVATECYLIAAMSYDRYLAICKPLHYSALMNKRSCLFFAAGSWLNGLLASTILTLFIFHSIFCGPNEIDLFYCDPLPLIYLACGDRSLIMLFDFILACVFTLPPFLLTLMSYIYIISTILRIPSTTGKQKTFSTCSSHLIVMTIFYVTIMTVYILPTFGTVKGVKKVLSLCYTVLTPLINPLIYSLRNKDMREALSKAFHQYVTVKLQKERLSHL